MSMIMNLLGFSRRSSRSSELTPEAINLIVGHEYTNYRAYVRGPDFTVAVSDAGYAFRSPAGLGVVMGDFSESQALKLTTKFVLKAMEIANQRVGDELGYRISVEMGSNISSSKMREILQGMVSER